TRVIVSTNPRNSALTHLIKKAADDNNCEFMDTYSTSSKWGNEYMNLENLNGTGDGHFNDAGYEKYGKLVAELAFGDFATWYYDNQEEITNNAVIVDQSATAGTGKVTYNWEGRAYNFTWGVNAFTDINTAIAYAKSNNWKKLQVLIPENKIQTGGTAFTISTDPTGLESIEVYGQNRKFDPNDKSASSTDPTADWSLSKKWDSYSTNGGTSAVGTITYSLAKGFGGELKFKGVTMRSNYVNTARTSGNMDQTFENCRVDFTTTSNVHLFFTESTWTRTGAMDETTLVKNFRVDGFKSTQRLVQQATSNNLFWHGVYIKQQSGKTGTCYQLASNKAQKARVEIIGCNFRDGANMFSIAPAQNIQKVYSVLVMKDNVYYNVAAINTIFPYFLNEVTVEGNYYVLPNITGAFTYASKFDGKEITTGDFAEIIKYTAKNNTFILPNTSYASNFDINNETKVDISGTYIAVYDANYANGIKGVKPDLGGVAKCDYYYLDFARTVKNTDLAIQSLGLADEVENLVISDGSITAKSDCGKVITDLSAVTGNEKVSVKFYKDSALTQEVTELEMGITSASETYYIKSSYGLESKVYTLTFTLSDPKDFTEYVDDSGEIDASKAIALIPSCSTLANGTEIAAQWQGAVYKFVKGTNAFATVADIKTKFGTTTALQIVMPAGTYTAQLDIHGPWKFYGENFKTNPNDIKADSASLSKEWGKFGNTILDNVNVVVAATASGD
ncbi:MAG: hypothetical protein IKY12_02580, partial [Clostridia bacterium]|nr:hypothetical protein [Clostridia bacterium]